jgi:hypothetical protein
VSLSNEYKVSAVSLVHLIEIHRGCVGMAPLIPTLDSVWR